MEKSRMALLPFSIHALVKVHTQQRRTKGQISGFGLQLCTSGVPAEPESVTLWRDQRHPHSQMSSTEEGERIEAKMEEDKNTFYNAELERGTLERAGLDTETLSETTHIPQWSGEESTNTFFCHQSAIQHFLCRGLDSVSIQDLVLRRFVSVWYYVLWGQICSWASL